MKVSKLFHWLYAILMFLPFGLVVYNALASMWSGNTIDFSTWVTMFSEGLFSSIGEDLASTIMGVYQYLVSGIFTLEGDLGNITIYLLTYWTCISIIWLVFDVFMYVPLLVHRWIDKAKIE